MNEEKKKIIIVFAAELKKIDKIKSYIISKINETNAFKKMNDFFDTIAKRLIELDFHTSTISMYYFLIVYISSFFLIWFGLFILPCAAIIFSIFISIMDRFLNRADRKFKFITGYIDLGNNMIEAIDFCFKNDMEYFTFRAKMDKHFYTTRTDNSLYFQRKNLNNTEIHDN